MPVEPQMMSQSISSESVQRLLLVVEKGGDSLGFYDEDGARVGGATGGHIPREVVLSPDKRLAYAVPSRHPRHRQYPNQRRDAADREHR